MNCELIILMKKKERKKERKKVEINQRGKDCGWGHL
jgi:hypothetical protein